MPSIVPPMSLSARVALLPVLALLAAAPALAQSGPSADEIAEAIRDKTYQGSMTADAFAEYYAADGTVRGKGYTGKWRAGDGELCLAYGDAAEECWDVTINGPAMTLMQGGEVDGSGMLVDGNPLDF